MDSYPADVASHMNRFNQLPDFVQASETEGNPRFDIPPSNNEVKLYDMRIDSENAREKKQTLKYRLAVFGTIALGSTAIKHFLQPSVGGLPDSVETIVPTLLIGITAQLMILRNHRKRINQINESKEHLLLANGRKLRKNQEILFIAPV